MRTILQTTLLFFFLFISTTVFATQLNGTYTIDASAAATATNFKEFNSAYSYMLSGIRSDGGPTTVAPFGVSGAVVFNVAAGIYSNQFNITAAITGVSISNTISFIGAGNTTTILQTSGTYYNDGPLVISTATSQNLYLKFKNIGINNLNSGSGVFLGNANFITLDNCKFSNTLSASFYNVYFLGNNMANDTLKNCTLDATGGVGMRFYSTGSSNCAIINNTITNAKTGLLIEYNSGLKIIGNTIQTISSDVGTGIYLSVQPTNNGAEISNNKVNILGGGIGITAADGYLNTNKVLIFNNAISVASTAASTGLQFGGYYTEVYHNTVSISNTNINSKGASFSGFGANFNFTNNVVQNTGGGYCINCATTSTSPAIISNNNYYHTGQWMGLVGGNKVLFAGWKSITGSPDANGKNIYVGLAANGYSHTTLCINSPIITAATKDITGVTRSNTTPTIGAYEMTTAVINNATMDSIVSVKGNQPSGTNIPVTFRIRNSGTASITSFTASYELNGGAAVSQTFSASLNSCDTARFTFTTPVSFAAGNNPLKVYISQVNGTTDTYPLGDTLTNNYSTALAGIYTINPSAANSVTNFTSFTKADSILINNGVAAPVIFDVSPGTYNESLSLTAFAGMGAANPVLFKPANGVAGSVIINSTIGIAAAKLVSVFNVGYKKINFIYSNTSTQGFYLNYCRNILVDSCNIKYAIAGNGAGYAINTGTNYNCIFSNNYLNKQATAIKTSYDSACTFFNNRIVNCSATPAIIDNFRSLNFDKNYIDSSLFTSGYSIDVSPNGTGDFSNITRNTIVDDKNYGINISSQANSTSKNFIVANNYLTHGMTLFNSTYVKIFHNTIYLKSGTAFYDIGFDTIKNNLVQLQPGLIANATTFNNTNNYNTIGYNFYGNNNNGEQILFPDAKSPVHNNYCALKVPQIPTVTTDFFGTARSALTTAGAYEPALVTNDAGVITLVLPNPISVTNAAPFTLKVRVRNNGSNPITNISLRYSLNGAAPVEQSFTTNLNTCDTASFTFTTMPTITQDVNNIKFYPQLVNGLSDGLNINDTLSKTLYVPMNGIFTINKAGSGVRNYKSFGEADSSLVTRGVDGAVTFNVSPGIYTENGTDLKFSSEKIAGLSVANNVLFNGINADSNAVNIFSSTAATLTLDSMKFLAFRKMTFNTVNISFANKLSNNITVENCRFISSSIATTTGKIDSVVVIRNNTFEAGAAITLIKPGPSIYDYPGNYPAFLNALTIEPCSKGILIEGNTGAAFMLRFSIAPIFKKNSNFSISYFNVKDSIVITGNRYGSIGITSNFSYPTSALIANNYLFSNGTYAALSCKGFDYKMYYNTVRAEATTASITATQALVEMGANAIFKNNIVSLKFKGIGTTTNGVGLIIAGTNPANINYNSYYSDYPTQSYQTFTLSTNVNSFTAWKAAGYDANSYFVYPKFDSTDITNFHPKQGLIANAGTPIAQINTDIEGEVRSASTPDIGCDEYDLPSADAGVVSYVGPNKVFAVGLQPLIVKIKNYGTANLTSVQVNWKLNGILQTPYSWNGTLNFDSLTNVTIANFNFIAGLKHDMVFWTSLPNNYTDTIYVNDTAKVFNIYAALNGNYTIGGSSPTFTNFTNTTLALKYGGVLGPVTFRARDGVYVETITLKEYTNVSAANPIIYEGESGDSSLVTLKYSNTIPAYFNTVTLDSADYITFRKMSIRTEGTGNGGGSYAISLINRANNNTINNCLLSGDVNNAALISVGAAAKSDSLVISNNRFKGNIAGLLLNGIENYVLALGLRVENNLFDSSRSYGMNLIGFRGAKISRNIFKNGQPYAYAMQFGNMDSITTITKNSIYNFTYGIFYGTCGTPIAQANIIANNMISTTNYGILSDASNPLIYNNTIKSGGAYVVGITGYNSAIIRNNILQSISNNPSLYFYNNLPNSNYNNLIGATTNIASFNGTNYTFATWKAYGQDVNSLNIVPQFVSDSNLHIPKTFLGFNKKATPVASVTDDFDGDPRDATMPDIGADEYTPYGNDANAYKILSPQSPFVASVQNVQIRIRNAGENNITTATIKWFVNGVQQTNYGYTGNLASGDSTTVILGSYNFSNAVSGDSLLIVTSLPNGVSDENILNDTLAVRLYPALCGAYTVGGAAPNFATPKAAIAAVNRGGISCPVIFNIRSGNYAMADTLNKIVGSSTINTLTFQSEILDSTAVVLQANCTDAPNGLLYLNGVNNVIFKNLTFKKNFTTCPTNFLINSGGSSSGNGKIIFANNYFNMPLVGSGSNISIRNGLLDSISIINNRFDSAGVGINTTGYANISNNIFTGAATVADTASKTFVQNNIIDSGAVIVAKLGAGLDSCFVTNNILNKGAGITIFNFTKGKISKNKIVYNRYTVAGAAALSLTNGSDAAGMLQVDNNFVAVLPNVGVPLFAIGIGTNQYSYLYNAVLWNNSINMLNTATNSAAFYRFYGAGIQLKNNSFVNAGGGYAAYFYIGALAAADTCNYNNYYSTGTNLGYYNSTTSTNLTAWKASTTKDGRSVSGAGVYVSNTDLHTNSTDLSNAGGPIPLITTDIDNEPRSATTPDIGADEFTLGAGNYVRTVKIYSHSTDSLTNASPTSNVTFKFKNVSFATLTNASFKLRVNNIDYGTPLNWTGSLNAGDTSSLQTIGTFNFKVDSAYKIEVISTTIGDIVPSDDTARVINKYAALNGTYTVYGITPDIKSLPNCLTALQNGGYTGNVTFNIRNGLYQTTLSMPGTFPTNNNNAAITFTSESGDSSAVTIIGSDNYLPTISIANSKNINFNKIGIRAISPYGLISLNTTKNVTINNCNFYGEAVGYSQHATGVSSVYDSALIIRKNYFNKTDRAITAAGYADGSSKDLIIDNNIAANSFGPRGISVGSETAPIIKNNILDGSMFVNATSYLISGNKINIHVVQPYNNVTGIGGNGTAVKPSLFVNNSVIMDCQYFKESSDPLQGTVAFTNFGMPADNDYTNIYNNTFATYNADTATVTFTVQGRSSYPAILPPFPKHINIKNNNIAAFRGKAFALELAGINSIDNNNLYFNNDSSAIGITYNGASKTYYNTLAAYKIANPAVDVNSVSIDPVFGDRDSYIPLNNLLDNKGVSLPIVPNDIDSIVRNNTTPDIGCAEFSTPLKDLSIVKVHTPQLFFPEGINAVNLLIRNNGATTITSATIKWKMLGIAQADVSWTGSLATNDSAVVTLGNYNFAIKTDNNILAWIDNSNGLQDVYRNNDTIRKALWCGLSRTYVLGTYPNTQAGDDFLSMGEIITQLYNGGVAAPSVIRIRNTQSLVPFFINKTPGTTEINTLTFEPYSNKLDSVLFSVLPINGDNNYAMVLYNAKHIRFKKIKFENKSTDDNYTIAVNMGYGSRDILFDSCRFVAKTNVVSPNSTLSTQSSLVFMPWYGTYPPYTNLFNDSIVFKNSLFNGGGYGMYAAGYGNDGYPRGRGLTITGCQFINQSYGGINVAFQDSSSFINNTITTNNKAYLFTAMNFLRCSYNLYVKNNKIAVAGDGIGINFFYTAGNLYQNGAALPSGQRLIRVVNNFVQIGDTAAASRGIFIDGSVGLYHNSINLTSNNANAAALEYAQPYLAPNNPIEMFNNIYRVDGPGLAIKTIDNIGLYTALPTSNFNDMITNGSYVAQRGTTKYGTRSNWYDATGYDLFSVSVNPLYYSKTDLHARSQYINNAATAIANIESTDIDEEARSATTPDIGADEFYPLNAGVADLVSPKSGCGLGNAEPIIVKVKNYGQSANAKIPVAYRINNGTIVRDTVLTNINAGDSLNYTIATTANLLAYGSYKIEAWTEVVGDSLINNDTTYRYVYSTPIVTSYPYLETFETGNGYFFTDGLNTSWAWGVIHSGLIDTAASGTKGWKTNLVGSYKNNELSYLHTPCFNLNGFTGASPWIWFSHAYALEPGADKNWVEYSSDAGTTWAKLGTSGQGENWYDNPIINVWDTTRTQWHRAGFQIPLNSISNTTAVRFRFVLQTNGTNIYDGVAIDDVNIDTIRNNNCLGSTFVYSSGFNNANSYQWQVDIGTGFTNISDNTIYSGTSTSTVVINNAPNTYAANKYRCVVVVNSITYYSTVQKLLYINTWTGNVDTDWFKTGNWSCGTVPDQYTDVTIPTGRPNYPVVNSNADVRSITLKASTNFNLLPGIIFNIKGK